MYFRHRAPTKRNRRHIDYLLSHSHTRVIRTIRSRLNECTLNQRTRGRIVVPRFRTSDCRRHNCSKTPATSAVARMFP
ncbi:MAG: DUF123 domain-containing protein [Bacteroidetes bacterium]|nr:DUF123 domain-containing protein [Bacteroidota bacterium]